MTLILRIFDVEHGACAMLAGMDHHALAMVDCGHNATTGWCPSKFLRERMRRGDLDYLLVTNADQDHISNLSALRQAGINVRHLISNPYVSPEALRWIKEQSGTLTDDAEALLEMRRNFGPPGSGTPFNDAMGGVTVRSFQHHFPTFVTTNNLSCAYFLKFGQ